MGPGDPQTCAHRRFAALAARQHGVVTRSQIVAVGLSNTMVRDRIANGHLIRLHRGVYAVGHDQLRREGRWLAAVLAVGQGAALSHRDAAALHDLRPANHELTDVTTPRRGRTSQPGIAVHHALLDSLDVTIVSGIPVTSVARTLVDLAGAVPADHLHKALSEAEHQRTFDRTAIEAALARTAGRHGSGHAALKAALADLADHRPTLTRSELEDRFLALLAAHGLPCPRSNARVGAFEVDALWRERRLAVELDGWTHHRTKRAFQRDRDKANALMAASWTVLRYTYADVLQRPAEVAAQLRPLLAP